MNRAKIQDWLEENKSHDAAQYFLERFDQLSEAQLQEIYFIAFEASAEEKKSFQTQKLSSMREKLSQLKHLTIEAKQDICAHREATQESEEEKLEEALLNELANAS